jgi:hypothetical protein
MMFLCLIDCIPLLFFQNHNCGVERIAPRAGRELGFGPLEQLRRELGRVSASLPHKIGGRSSLHVPMPRSRLPLQPNPELAERICPRSNRLRVLFLGTIGFPHSKAPLLASASEKLPPSDLGAPWTREASQLAVSPDDTVVWRRPPVRNLRTRFRHIPVFTRSRRSFYPGMNSFRARDVAGRP